MVTLGFAIFELEDYPVETQIKIVTEAEIVVSPHGAALTYTLFCQPGTKIIEIFKQTNSSKRHFIDIARECDLNFYRFDNVTLTDDMENMNVNTKSLVDFLNDTVKI